MEIINKIVTIVINIFMWIWSHCPIMCLSDDNNFATLDIKKIRKSHLRFSLFNIMLGDSITYIVSFDIKEKKFSFVKLLHLAYIDGNFLTDEKIEQIQNRFRDHIEQLENDDLLVEKEKLIYHIDKEEQRINTSMDKINIYATIILTVIPIATTLIDFEKVKDFSFFLKVIACTMVYSLVNVCIYVFRAIKVHGLKKSSFTDLRESCDKGKEILVQYQYDWQQLKYKAQLFVSFVSNLQEWVVFLLMLTVGISLGVSTYNDNTVVETNEVNGIVFTIQLEEIDVPYSDSAVDWQTLILDIEKKQCDHIIILLNNKELSKYVKELTRYEELKIELIEDVNLEKDIIKLIEVK